MGKNRTAKGGNKGAVEVMVELTINPIDQLAERIMRSDNPRETFKAELAKLADSDRPALVLACKSYQERERAERDKAQAERDALSQAERDLFGVPVTVQGNHRPESKGKQLTLALERGATMTELLAIRGAVPQHFRYLRKHGFTISYDKASGIYRALAS